MTSEISTRMEDRASNAQSLRIAMLTTFYPPYNFGGDGIGIQRLTTALAKRGHQITIIHDIDAYRTLAPGEPAPIEHPDGVRVIGLRTGSGPDANPLGGKLSNLLTHQLGRPIVHRARLQEILAPDAFDVVWFHNISLVGGPGLLSYGHDAVKIYEAHEHWLVCPTHVLWRHNKETCDERECLRCVLNYRRPPQVWRGSAYFDRQLDEVDAFIAKSEFSRDKHRDFGFPKEMRVVPYFLPSESDGPTPRRPVDPAPAPDSPHPRPYFLFVGRLEKIKGLDDVIPAMANYPDADLLILGSGEYEDELHRQAEGIPNVRFLGRLPPEELARYYAAAIALIVPSVCFETFGIILIESFREGTPVIAREIGPFPEIVNRCGGGFLFSNESELVEAMRTLHGDPEVRARMAEAAREGFERYWGEEAVIGQYLATVRDAALRKGHTRVAEALDPMTSRAN